MPVIMTGTLILDQTDLMIDDEIDQEKKKIDSSSTKETNDRSSLMKNVVFVLNGFSKSLRSEIQTKATSMGATYSHDWTKKCTHLISEVAFTPTYAQIEQSGKGLIVNQNWILDCYQENQLFPETAYPLRKRKSKNNEESNKKTTTKRKISNEKKDNVQFEELPSFFHGIHFYVSYGDYDDNTLLDITRVILAYDGILERQVNEDVKYVITNRFWNQDFEKIFRSNPYIKFLNLDWLQDCHDANQFVAVEPYQTIRP